MKHSLKQSQLVFILPLLTSFFLHRPSRRDGIVLQRWEAVLRTSVKSMYSEEKATAYHSAI